MNKKVQRNDPCPCGSGKKYKNCCLKKEQGKQKTYTPDGKRKFKAKVLSGQPSSMSIPPIPSLADPDALEKLKFRMGNKDYRTDATVAENEKEATGEAEKPSESAPTHKAGDKFEKASDDFRSES